MMRISSTSASGKRPLKAILYFSALAAAAAFFAFSSVAASALAQTILFVAPSGGTYQTGDLFSVLVNVNSGGKAINAVSGQLNFDNTRLEVDSIGYSRSLLTLWTQEPTFSNPSGAIVFSGGLPSPGFSGASGNILRVTFRAKAKGQAPVVFVSGSALANDGLGTNILDHLEGGLYSILPASAPAAAPPSAAPAALPAPTGKAEAAIEVPTITDYPKQIVAGDVLMIRGIGLPAARIVIDVQKGENVNLEHFDAIAGGDGHFSFVYPQATEAGFYRIWARNVTADGIASAQSDTIVVEVVAPLFFRIGNIAVNYGSIVMALLGVIFLLVLILGIVWWRVRKRQMAEGIEISEAERAVHYGFDNLKAALGKFIGELLESKSPKDMKKREELLSSELARDIREIEEKIEKEVEDAEHPEEAHKKEKEKH